VIDENRENGDGGEDWSAGANAGRVSRQGEHGKLQDEMFREPLTNGAGNGISRAMARLAAVVPWIARECANDTHGQDELEMADSAGWSALAGGARQRMSIHEQH
jgi:hypothetical protein